ncbi:IclR family transcriptional regulator domain-containing protein [Campylobacter jejuni]|uniref:IclR family transcriptional regulator domain-containing protein n=1 Tax=Campylobacter jejuni TaxID=197 RepID=UPI003F49884A
MNNIMKVENFLAQKSINYDKIDRFLMFRMYEKYKKYFKNIPIIQLIGTNGKGSTGRYLTQLLENLNYKIGHYTSPHIFSFNERFYLDGKIANDEELEQAHIRLEEIFKQDLQKLSYFEYATFLAMILFQKCDFIVLEAGVGGEYDATSIFERRMSIFTRIGFDHIQILGNSLEDIARTKLKVMAPIALISDEQEQNVLNLAKKIAFLKKANLQVSSLNPFLKEKFEIYCKKFVLPYFLKHNLKLALKACEILTSQEKTLEALKKLQELNLQGRCQEISPNFFVDVGHNPMAAKAMLDKFQGEKINLIYNAYLDKDIFQILNTLKPIIDTPTLRVLNILELLAKEKLTLSAIAKKLNIPAGTLWPILQTLQEKKYIKCDLKNKSYYLDFKIIELGCNIKNENNIFEIIKKHMKNIRNLTNQTCQMGILKDGNVLYLEKIDANNTVQLKSFIGTSYPAYATSLGKALLSNKNKKELEKLYPKNFDKITENTLNNINELYQQIKQIKKEKIAIEIGEMNPQIECMAIGIEHKNKIIAAISISYLIYYSNKAFREKNKKILLEEKNKIEKVLKIYFNDLDTLY